MSSSENDHFCEEKNLVADESFHLESASSNLSESDRTFGPSQPPHLVDKIRVECKCEQKIYGPALPDNLRSKENENEILESKSASEMMKKQMIGPEIPEHLKFLVQEELGEPNLDDSADAADKDDSFGPSPSLMVSDDFSRNYKSVGIKKVNPGAESALKKKRDSWMLELPSKKGVNFSSVNRRFRKRVNTDKESDQFVWTETPETRLEKKKGEKTKNYEEILKTKMMDERNEEMEILAEKYSKKLKGKKSLLEMHLKKMKKKKKEAKKEKVEKKIERRPFDRNIDLQVHRFDETKKKLILNKATYLNSRFASGENKFL